MCAIHPHHTIHGIHSSRIQRQGNRLIELTRIGICRQTCWAYRYACCIATKGVVERITIIHIDDIQRNCLRGCCTTDEVRAETHRCWVCCSRGRIQTNARKWDCCIIHTACSANYQVACAITHIACNKTHRNARAELRTACCGRKAQVSTEREITRIRAGG